MTKYVIATVLVFILSIAAHVVLNEPVQDGDAAALQSTTANND